MVVSIPPLQRVARRGSGLQGSLVEIQQRGTRSQVTIIIHPIRQETTYLYLKRNSTIPMRAQIISHVMFRGLTDTWNCTQVTRIAW